MIKYFDFEEGIEKIDTYINTLLLDEKDNSIKIKKLEEDKKKLFEKIYSNLTPWQKVQISRHNDRPHTIDYIKNIFEDVVYLHGDKKYSDDNAIIGGFAKVENNSIIFMGTEKGNSMESRIKHNFGMAKPEGYRKALRIMKFAEKFNLPIITLLDTPGAYPGIGAEERGQGSAIAQNLIEMANLRVPIISIVIGEGASGGALGIGLADKIICLENTWYSVISPEGCASILFRDPSMASSAADSMKVTANDLLEIGIADEILKEPDGAAHISPDKMSDILKETIIRTYTNLKKYDLEELIKLRNEKYDKIGYYEQR